MTDQQANGADAAADAFAAAFPDIWCSQCTSRQPMLLDVMHAGRLNDRDAADLVCSRCHSIIATVHAKGASAK